MRNVDRYRLSIATLLCTAGLLLPLRAQTADAKCKHGQASEACRKESASSDPSHNPVTQKAPKSAADFAFPADDSKHGADPDGTPSKAEGAKPPGALPDMPTGPVPDPPASSERPLSGTAPASDRDSDNLPPGTSSSRAEGQDPDDDIAPTTAAPDAPIKATRLKDMGSRGDSSAAREKLEATRVEDDLKVGLFYTKDGNTQGAYLRFKDALDRAPADPDVRFYLAESASRLNKHDEAVLNYRECLRLDPGGDHDKASRKALGKLGAAPTP